MRKFLFILTLLIHLTTITDSNNYVPPKGIYGHLFEGITVVGDKSKVGQNKAKIDRFLYAMGERESGNNPYAINQYGYRGKYQFGSAALKDVGYGDITLDKFRNNPDIFPEAEQDKAMIKYMKLNQKILEKYIKIYVGKKINGIEITESGIYAAAHLVGARAVMNYLSSWGKSVTEDAYGTSVENYMKDFSHYDFDLDLIQV